MALPLTCTKILTKNDGTHDNNGKLQVWHEACGRPAAEYTLTGTLTEAKAVLCVTHKQQAEREIERQKWGKGRKRSTAG